MKEKILTALIFLASLSIKAQQDAQYSQYMFNTININPAYAGTRGTVSILGLHRAQWIGLDGAPITSTLSINAPIGDTKLGFGVSLINDKIGPIANNTLSADLSYTVDLDYYYRLSFGLKANANLFDFNLNKLNPSDAGDIELKDIRNSFSPNFGTGVYLHSDEGYIGISVRNILKTMDPDNIAFYKERLNYYLIGGYVFDVDYTTQFKPAFLAKAVKGAPLQLDLSANFLFNEKLNLGIAYRWSAAVSAMAGFQLSDSLYIGYAYDFDTISLGKYNSGSHEIFLRYEISKQLSRITAPRFF